MNGIAAIGEEDAVLGLKIIGIDVFEAGNASKAAEQLKECAKKGYKIICLTETAAEHLQAEIDEYNDRISPAVILIPGSKGATGIGKSRITAAIERAVGADILGE